MFRQKPCLGGLAGPVYAFKGDKVPCLDAVTCAICVDSSNGSVTGLQLSVMRDTNPPRGTSAFGDKAGCALRGDLRGKSPVQPKDRPCLIGADTARYKRLLRVLGSGKSGHQQRYVFGGNKADCLRRAHPDAASAMRVPALVQFALRELTESPVYDGFASCARAAWRSDAGDHER